MMKRENSITIDKVAKVSGVFNEESVLEFAEENMLPALRDEKGDLKRNRKGKALFHPVAEEIALQVRAHVEYWGPFGVWDDDVDIVGVSIKEVLARYKRLASEFQKEGAVPKLIEGKIEILRSLKTERSDFDGYIWIH